MNVFIKNRNPVPYYQSICYNVTKNQSEQSLTKNAVSSRDQISHISDTQKNNLITPIVNNQKRNSVRNPYLTSSNKP